MLSRLGILVPELIDTMVVREDIGSYEPRYKKAILQFWNDGTITWTPRDPSPDFNPYSQQDDVYVGDPELVLDKESGVLLLVTKEIHHA